MKALRLLALTIALALLGILAVAAGAQEQAPSSNGGCTSTAGYDPACDVDHDDDIDIHDIQLTAGHWNETGTWMSDSNHDHLGQIWNGSYSLVINGTFGPPDFAALVLNNSETEGDGLLVESAGGDGVHVKTAGLAGSTTASTGDNGFEVEGAENHGLYVGQAGMNGVEIFHAGIDGVFVGSASNGVVISSVLDHGVVVDSANNHGIKVTSAGNDGVRVVDASDDGFEVWAAGGNGVEVGTAASNGVYVDSAINGVTVNSTDDHGLQVNTAGNDGVNIGSAGQSGVWVGSAINGVTIDSATQHGLSVNSATQHGLKVLSAGNHGVRVIGAVDDGLEVWEASGSGVEVNAAANYGVYAHTENTDHNFGLYTPDRVGGSNIATSSQTLIAQVAGTAALYPGDIVAAIGLAEPLPGSQVPLALVRLADGRNASGLVGVVEGRRVAIRQEIAEEDAAVKSRFELHNAPGAANAGNYVALTVLGVAQVKVTDGADIQPGQQLTAATDGKARPLGTVKVQVAGGEGTVDMTETAPTIGIALAGSEPGQETIPVFVTLR